MPRTLEKPEPERYDPSPVQGSFSLLQIAWKRKPLIALGAVLGLLIGWVYFLQRPAIFESTAQIKVERTFPSGPLQGFDGGMTLYEDYIATQMQLLQSQKIVRAAVHGGKLNELPSYAGQSEAAATGSIRSSFSVTRVLLASTSSPTNCLNLTVRGSNSEDCATVLQQIIASYETYLKEDHTASNKKSFDELLDMHTKLEKEIAAGNANLRKMRETNKIIRNKDGESLDVEVLSSLQTRRKNVAVRRDETKFRLEAIKSAIAKGSDPTPYLDQTPESNKLLNTNPEGLTLDDMLRPDFIRERELLVQYGPAHPEVVQIQAKIKATREVWEKHHADAVPKVPASKEKVASKEAVEAYLKLLAGQLIDLELSEQALTALVDRESKTLRDLASVGQDEITLTKDMDDKRELARTYRKRMDEVNLVKDHGGIVTDTMAEPTPGFQVEPKATPILLAALMGGLLLGVGMAWLAEVTDQSFRNPEDIRRLLKVQVLGHVPRIAPTAEEKRMAEEGLLPMDPSICAFYQPKSIDAEAFRGLRTTLFFKLEGQGHKVIQITSPNMGDGKTTLATNLAVSIAQSGKRILLIDADFRRPRLHKMFGVDATTGLASVIAEDADLQDAIKACPVPNLFLLPCGPRPNNPAELLTSKRFLDLLDVLREQFDIILVDTPPLLAVSDPSVLAPRVDGVLLTIRVAKNGRPAAERAREILTNLGANVYGVVVNGIDGTAGQGYGASQYGYTYNYAYGYNYEAADNSSYYHDSDGDVPVNGTHAGNGATNGTNGTSRKSTRKGRPRKRRAESGGLIRWLRESLWH